VCQRKHSYEVSSMSTGRWQQMPSHSMWSANVSSLSWWPAVEQRCSDDAVSRNWCPVYRQIPWSSAILASTHHYTDLLPSQKVSLVSRWNVNNFRLM